VARLDNKLAQASKRKAQPSLKSGALKPHSLRPKESERKERQTHLEAAYAIVHPDNGSEIETVMARFVTAMQSYHNGHAAKFTGDQGSAWRDWLAAAPVVKK
jgi:hypothetical protein